MTCDVLFGPNGKSIGKATREIDSIEELAKLLDVPESEVYRGTFRVVGDRLVKASNGDIYTYWSKVGPIDIASFVQLSEISDMEDYFFRRDGKLVVFLSLEDAVEAGYRLDECEGKENHAEMVSLWATGVTNERVAAVMTLLEPYME